MATVWKKLVWALAAALAAAALAPGCSTPDFEVAEPAAPVPDSGPDVSVPTGCDADPTLPDCGAPPPPPPDAGAPCTDGCLNDHGTTRCVAGLCAPICASGFGDCNGDPSDGCETDLSTPQNCGACGTLCALDHASTLCESSFCRIDKCNAGFDDCDGDPKNGCEADLSKPETCGACGTQCNANGGTATCVGGICGITCTADHADCANGLVDGCETDTSGNVLHCGSCAKACPLGGGTPSCVEGMCGVSNCTSPLADCNADATLPGGNGCETNTSTDVNNCGGCGIMCYFPNANAQCIGKACQLNGCLLGYADCTVASGCETKLGTTTNCLDCGDACSNGHGTTACVTSGCSPTCAAEWGDCDLNRNNGCETPLTTLTDCTGCGMPCAFPHASASCATGSCVQGACDAGWADCTGAPGCETANACATGGGGAGGGAGTGGSGTGGAGGSGGSGGSGTGSFCSLGSYAFCDDFDDGNANGWAVSGGTWGISIDGSDVYAQTGTGTGSNVLLSNNGTPTWTDQTVSAKIKITKFGGQSTSYFAGLYARYVPGSYYSFVLRSDGKVAIRKNATTIGSAVVAGIVEGTWYDVRFVVIGSTLQGYINGTLLVTETDASLTAGAIALSAVNTTAEFDNVTVTVP